MSLYPAYLSLSGRKCLVVGNTTEALKRAAELECSGAELTIVSREALPAESGFSQFYKRGFEPRDLDGCWFAVAASANPAENRQLADACAARQIFCHVAGEMSGSAALPAHGNRCLAGTVALVGAGPGDPELLTLRALGLIQSADAVVYDRLVSEPILGMCNPEATMIYAGKAKADHALPQESINQLLVDLAKQGRKVVRLKGGDPFIFGRGGEEIETLASNGVDFQVVPGITAASGCSAYSGIPLTHRDHAQSVIFITGHLQTGGINLNWQELRDETQTIVVYTGLSGLDTICQGLIAHGRDAETPAALVEQGTTKNQRVFSSTLARLPDEIARAQVSAPTLLIIGSVVNLRENLAWFSPESP